MSEEFAAHNRRRREERLEKCQHVHSLEQELKQDVQNLAETGKNRTRLHRWAQLPDFFVLEGLIPALFHVSSESNITAVKGNTPCSSMGISRKT